jgi:hypothetical protein
MTNFLFKFINRFLTVLLPFVAILASVNLNISNPDLYKDVLIANKVYPQTSKILQSNSFDQTSDQSKRFQSIIFATIFNDLATESWVQNITEKNIDALTNWLGAKSPNLELYLPIDQIQTSVQKNIATSTKYNLQNTQLPVCQNLSQKNNLEEIVSSFCIPNDAVDVSTFKKTFENLTSSNQFLDQYLQNKLPFLFSTKSNTINLEKTQSEFATKFVIAGQFFFKLRSILIPLLLICLILALVNIIIFSRRKRFCRQLGCLFRNIGLQSILLSFGLLCSFGGLAYVSSFLKELILPGLLDNGLSGIWLWSFVCILFLLVLPAILFGLTSFLISILFFAFDKIGLFRSLKLENLKIQKVEQKVVHHSQPNIRERAQKYNMRKMFYDDFDKGYNNFSSPNSTPNNDFNYDIIKINNDIEKGIHYDQSKDFAKPPTK